MPIKWTPELDSILLHGVFEECNISFSKALCAKIAERVNAAGMECTPKAVENRLYTWKKKNVSGNTGLNSSTTNTAANSPAKSTTTAAAGTPKTPASRSKMISKKKGAAKAVAAAAAAAASSDESLDDSFSPSAGRGKRVRKTPAVGSEDEGEEEVYVPMGKRVKVEPREEEGFGCGEEEMKSEAWA